MINFDSDYFWDITYLKKAVYAMEKIYEINE